MTREQLDKHGWKNRTFYFLLGGLSIDKRVLGSPGRVALPRDRGMGFAGPNGDVGLLLAIVDGQLY